MEDPEAHLTAFHTQMMLVGGSDLIVEVQTAARAPLCSLLFRYLQTERNEGAIAREEKPRTKTTLVNRREQLIFINIIHIINIY